MVVFFHASFKSLDIRLDANLIGNATSFYEKLRGQLVFCLENSRGKMISGNKKGNFYTADQSFELEVNYTFFMFLVANKRLYKSPCLSVCLSIRRSGRSIKSRPAVTIRD